MAKSKAPLQDRVSLAVLVILHSVGLLGLNLESFRQDFTGLIWVNLVFVFGIVMSLHNKWNWRYLAYVLGVFALGFGVEVAGVKTGRLFGEYSYTSNLGQLVFSVPLVIGLNWVVLTYCAGSLARRIDPSTGVRILAGALLMVGLDVLIEPFAIRYELWTWAGGQPPLLNYLGWFGTALIAQTAYHGLLAKTKNPIAIPTFFVLLVFFALDWSLARLLGAG
jgi:uncharacterized membrane protein